MPSSSSVDEDVAAFVGFLVVLFVFCVNIFVDLVCTALFLLSLVVVWRAPFAILAVLQSRVGPNSPSLRDEIRSRMVSQFGIALVDLVCIPMGIITLFTWRGPVLARQIWSVFQEQPMGTHLWRFGMRISMFMNFWLFVSDIPFVAMLIWLHVAVWRTWKFWYRAVRWPEHQRHIHSYVYRADRPWYEICFRWLIVTEFFHSLTDIVFGVMVLFVHLTVWRTWKFWGYARHWPERERAKYPKDYKSDTPWFDICFRELIFREFLIAVIDALVLPFACLVLVTGYRIRPLMDDLQTESEQKNASVADFH